MFVASGRMKSSIVDSLEVNIIKICSASKSFHWCMCHLKSMCTQTVLPNHSTSHSYGHSGDSMNEIKLQCDCDMYPKKGKSAFALWKLQCSQNDIVRFGKRCDNNGKLKCKMACFPIFESS